MVGGWFVDDDQREVNLLIQHINSYFCTSNTFNN